MVQPQFKGQTYGEATQQQDRLRQVPTGRPPTEQAQQARPQVRPMAPGSLVAPTQRPTEPITAGAPFGPGPTPAAAGIPQLPSAADNALAELRIIAQNFSSEELNDLLDAYEFGA
jgi:hypothetical protein